MSAAAAEDERMSADRRIVVLFILTASLWNQPSPNSTLIQITLGVKFKIGVVEAGIECGL